MSVAGVATTLASILARRYSMLFEPMSVAQMYEIDQLMVEEYGIALLQMMENAGSSQDVLTRHMLGGSAAGRWVVVVAGKRNNGGGGLAALTTEPMWAIMPHVA